MARVKLNETADVAESHRWLFERIEKNGPVLNIFRALSHSPEALLRFMRFGSYLLEQGKLDPKLREVAILRAGAICRSPYEFSQHIAFGRRVGLTDDQIRAIAGGDGAPLTDHERAVMRYAEEMTRDARVSDEAFGALHGFLDDEQIVELTLVVGFYNLVSRTLNALDVEVDPPAAKDLETLAVKL
jgi:alkylhydroperoxidase family enzyme